MTYRSTPRVSGEPAIQGAAQSRSGRGLLAAVISVAVVLLAVLGAAPAAAHSDLISSSPAEGANLNAPPSTVELTFNEPIGTIGLQLAARGPNGEVPLGEPTVAGTVVSAPWPQSAGAGNYTVAFRVVSADGHPISGTVPFSIASQPSPATSPAATAVPEPSSQPAATSEASPVAASAADSGGFPWWIAVVAVIVGVGIGAVIARTMRARSASSPHSGEQS